MARLANDLYGEVIAIGGTISGEHADGLSRTAFIRQQYGPLADVFRQVKQIFDPQNIFNPGKIVSDEDPELLTSNLRHLVVPAPEAATENGDAAEPQPHESGGAANVAVQLGRRRHRPDGPQLQRLRGVPLAVERRADVPDLSLCPGRRELAPGQGQSDAQHSHRRAAADHADQRRVQSGHRPVRQLPHVPAWSARPASTFPS